MTGIKNIAQLFLRIALGFGFIYPVMDRCGLLGAPGSGKAAWGDWSHFVDYTNVLLPFLSRAAAGVTGLIITLAESITGICLIIGFKVKLMGLVAAVMTVCFAVFMISSLDIGAPFRYPVFVFTGAGLLLSAQDVFKWSVDYYLGNKLSTKKEKR